MGFQFVASSLVGRTVWKVDRRSERCDEEGDLKGNPDLERIERSSTRHRNSDKPTSVVLRRRWHWITSVGSSKFSISKTERTPEIQPHQEEDRSLRKRLKFLKACKDQLWSRWKREYLTAFRERHKLLGKTTKLKVVVGDVVIDKNRGNWPLVVVGKTFPGKDGKIRTVKLKTSNGELERPVQHLFPLELPCDRHQKEDLNPEAPVFHPRRDAAVAATTRIQETAEHEQYELWFSHN